MIERRYDRKLGAGCGHFERFGRRAVGHEIEAEPESSFRAGGSVILVVASPSLCDVREPSTPRDELHVTDTLSESSSREEIYLIRRTGSRDVEASGFARGDASWHLPGISVQLEPNETVRIEKEHFATTPLFYAALPEALIAATDYHRLCELIVRSTDTRLQVDPDYVRLYLMFQCPVTARTYCKNVRSLRAGETVRCTVDGNIRHSLQPVELTEQESARVPSFLDALEPQIAELNFESTVFHLSAGLDSSALVLLANRRAPRLPLRVVTANTLARGCSDELETVSRLADDHDLALSVVDLREIDLAEAGEALARALGSPIGHPSHLVRFFLDREAARTSDTVVTGRGPDEVLGGYPWCLDELLDPEVHRQLVTVTEQRVLDELFPSSPRAHDDGSVSFEGWKKTAPLSRRDRAQYDLWSLFEAWNLIDAAFGRRWNIRGVSPFLNATLQSECFNVLAGHGRRGGEGKWLLRDQLGFLYSDYLLKQPKRGLRLDLRPYWQSLGEETTLQLLVDNRWAADSGLSVAAVGRMVEATCNDGINSGWQLWNLYLCACAYDVLGCE